MPGAIFSAAKGAREGRRDRPGQRRRVRLGVEDPRPGRRAAPGRTKSPSAVPRPRAALRSMSVTSAQRTSIRSAEAQRPRVGAGDRRRQRVAVDREDARSRPARARARRRRCRSTGPRHSRTPARGEARRARWAATEAAGRLLDAVRREEHPVRVRRAELRHRPLPQPRLPQRRRHQPRVVLAAQPGGDRQFLGRVVLAQRGEQGAALVGEQEGRRCRGRSPRIVVQPPARCGPGGRWCARGGGVVRVARAGA